MGREPFRAGSIKVVNRGILKRRVVSGVRDVVGGARARLLMFSH